MKASIEVIYDRISNLTAADYKMLVRHEAAREMRKGPSEPTYRRRFQITSSCCGQEP
jgi:hypothetical protein